ncbi:MAG TPA: hypothetical protein VI818_07045, partial [Candidatus Thermoplasmatota archaeon]|nr:hypothetical protein [Candidatus Thermoplasmatota archaeon]
MAATAILLAATTQIPDADALTLTTFNVTALTYNTAVETTWQFDFDARTSVPSTGRIHIVFPAGFVVGALATCRLGGTALTTVVTPSTDVICALTGASLTAGSSYTVTVDKVTNPTTAGVTGAFTFETQDLILAVYVVQDDQLTNTETIVTQTLTGLDVTSASYLAGATTTWTVQFTTVDAVPATGNVRINLPTGFTATNLVSTCRLSGTALVTAVTGSADVSCALASGLGAATSYTFTVDNVVNPTSAQTTGAFTIQTRTGANAVINTHTTDTETIVA